ncbi:MAG TPA: hypothetical protein VN177_06800 [Myxococcales bacterium]|nr:hypothetical protein [Myxococcales bacterium]
MYRPAAWTIAAFIVASAGCASIKAKRAREDYLVSRLDSVRYRQPLDEIWPEVQKVLAANRYPLVGKDAEAVGEEHIILFSLFSPAKETEPDGSGGRVLETGWRKDSTRIRAQATPDESGTRVVLTLLKEDTTEHGHDARERKPAVDLELQLAKKLDPEAAADIEAGLQAVKPD